MDLSSPVQRPRAFVMDLSSPVRYDTADAAVSGIVEDSVATKNLFSDQSTVCSISSSAN